MLELYKISQPCEDLYFGIQAAITLEDYANGFRQTTHRPYS